MAALVTPQPGYDAALAQARAEALQFAKRPVQPAQLVSSSRHDDGNYTINTLVFTTPLKHLGTEGEERIQVTVRAVLAKTSATGTSTSEPTACAPLLDLSKPIAAYLVGGPGSDNPPMAHAAVNKFYTDKGFQILYMDYRGMGDSTEVRFDTLSASFAAAQQGRATCRLAHRGSDEQIAAYLAHFRQDNIVRDLEAVRRYLCGEAHKAGRGANAVKLTLIGQSYGGWVSFTYLSLYPAGLDMVLVTGGVPPVGQSAATVYQHTFASTARANERFYAADAARVELARRVVAWVDANTTSGKTIAMPGGGYLTKARFLCLGRTFGTTDGDAKAAASLAECASEIDAQGRLSDDMLLKIESWFRFEERPLYCILQEAIYTEMGLPASDWAAEKVAKTLPAYAWLAGGGSDDNDDDRSAPAAADDRPFFYAEHVFRFHYEQFHAMRGLEGAADVLARKTDWAPLFDADQLRANTVPVASLGYENDIFIDAQLSQITADRTASMVHRVSRTLMHTAVKDRSDEVLPLVWDLLGDAVAKCRGVDARHVSADDRKDAASLVRCLRQ